MDRIIARQPLAALFRQSLQVMFDHLPRMGKGHVEMGIIIGPHAVLFAPPGEEARADIILKEGAINMLGEDLAGLALDRQ